MSRLGNVGGRLYRGEVSFDFVGRQKLWYRISGAILVISIAALLIFRLQYSVDFKGGSVFTFKAPAATSTQVSSTVTNAGGGNTLTVQQVNGTSWQVQPEVLNQKANPNDQNAIADRFPWQQFQAGRPPVGRAELGRARSLKALELCSPSRCDRALSLAAFEWRMATAALIASCTTS
jgi:preprotein translocase subunit SecF